MLRLLDDESGGEVLEYALIAGLIVVAAIAVIGSIGGKVLASWSSLNSSPLGGWSHLWATISSFSPQCLRTLPEVTTNTREDLAGSNLLIMRPAERTRPRPMMTS